MITDDALLGAVRLSHRYLTARQLPDKSVSVLDTACARIAIGQNTVPPAIEDATRLVDQIEREMKILQRESLIGHNHKERVKSLEKTKETTQSHLETLNKKWQKEKDIAITIQDLWHEIQEIHEKDPESKEISKSQKQLKMLEKRLAKAQGDSPLVQIAVNAETISEVISGWTGIPTGRMMTNEIDTVLCMEDSLAERIIGQDHALAAIAQMVQTAHAGIEDPSKPTAVFLFVGPSGVGKTETALTLSELLYGGEQNLISINMSEYQEAHTVSGLKGSPPGYVGYGEGGC